LNQIKGKTRKESGKVTDNKSEQIRGKAELAAGTIQEQYGKLKAISKNNRRLVIRYMKSIEQGNSNE
jgi:uncharacterized protein YjbJ (UPF0337 family)